MVLILKFCARWTRYFCFMIEAINNAKSAIFAQPNRAEVKAGREFEAVMLSNFVEQMLPENMGETEAPQAGAGVWRSFMAQAIADQLATQNATGVSSLIAHQLMQVRESHADGA
jgi:peptidoglycan hydrolase FlgJ